MNNRKQRRHPISTKKPTAINKAQLELAIKQDKQKMLVQAVKLYSVAVAYTLFNKQDFAKERLHEVLGQISELFDAFNEDYLTFVEAERILQEEADFVIAQP